MDVPFSKYSGCGNDFIFIDNRRSLFKEANHSLISTLCQRPKGIGADGVIFLENSQKADFKMRIFNSDGGEAEMCGNGIRCLKKYLCELGIENPSLSIETQKSQIQIEDAEGLVKVYMGTPEYQKLDMALKIDGKTLFLQILDTGVPHAVLFVDELEAADVCNLGRKIRFHPDLGPKGANANFVKILDESTIAIRTYERGVEGETLACGTGATASALAAAIKYHLKAPIEVKTRSHESLIINFSLNQAGFPESVTQTGPVCYHFRGNFAL